MDIQRIHSYKSTFDSVAHEITNDDGDVMEVWYARELQELLGYSKWDNFITAINRAIDSCKTQDIEPTDHFLDVGKMIETGKGAKRKMVRLTSEISNLFEQSHAAEVEIKKQLKPIGYEL